MENKIRKILTIWHDHFKDEQNQYSEYEPSDIEYFVGCMLYNHFAFSKAIATMKTMDLSYDFLSSCGDEYDAVTALVNEIDFDTEKEKLAFLNSFVQESRAKYTADESYLLTRLANHIKTLQDIYAGGLAVENVDFENPLYR